MKYEKTVIVCYNEEKTIYSIKQFTKIKHLLAEIPHPISSDYPERTVFVVVYNKKILPLDYSLDAIKNKSVLAIVARKPYVAYVRLSCKKQTAEYGFVHQMEMITRYVFKNNGVIIIKYEEIGSARTMERCTRPKFHEAVQLCKGNNYTLVTSKVDRMVRSVDQIVDLERLGIRFEIAELGSRQERFILYINAAIAEEESRLISLRTRKAMEELRLKGLDYSFKANKERSLLKSDVKIGKLINFYTKIAGLDIFKLKETISLPLTDRFEFMEKIKNSEKICVSLITIPVRRDILEKINCSIIAIDFPGCDAFLLYKCAVVLLTPSPSLKKGMDIDEIDTIHALVETGMPFPKSKRHIYTKLWQHTLPSSIIKQLATVWTFD